jgi:hypothetical protein
MSSTALKRAENRYQTCAFNARAASVQHLRDALGVSFSLGEWSHRAREAYEAQWLPHARHPDAGWDWPTTFGRYRRVPARLDLVIWGPDERLCGLGLATTTSESVYFHLVEGDPRPDCPLKGKRLLICLDATATYGQMLGKKELRCRPANVSLGTLYTEHYGFELVTPRKEKPYYKRNV